MNSSPFLSAQSISKIFPKPYILPVLQDVSFEVREGQLLSVVGRSGCGKTTLLEILCGIQSSTSGQVERRGALGYMPQKALLLPWRNVIENILLPIELQRPVGEDDGSRARVYIERFGLKGFEKSFPAQLSGGMQQKVSLIRTIVSDPDILLCDEPFSAIDFDARLKLGKDLRTLVVTQHKAAILVTHNIEEAIALADEIIVLCGRPSLVCTSFKVTIPDEAREPVALRKTEIFQNLFEQIWQALTVTTSGSKVSSSLSSS